MRAGKFIQADFTNQLPIGQGGIAKHKAIPIAGKGKRHAHAFRIFRGLLDASAHGVAVVFGFNHRQGLAKLIAQQIIRTQGSLHIALRFLAAHHNTAVGDGVFAVNLVGFTPARLEDGRVNKLRSNICFAELLFIQWVSPGFGLFCKQLWQQWLLNRQSAQPANRQGTALLNQSIDLLNHGIASKTVSGVRLELARRRWQ